MKLESQPEATADLLKFFVEAISSKVRQPEVLASILHFQNSRNSFCSSTCCCDVEQCLVRVDNKSLIKSEFQRASSMLRRKPWRAYERESKFQSITVVFMLLCLGTYAIFMSHSRTRFASTRTHKFQLLLQFAWSWSSKSTQIHHFRFLPHVTHKFVSRQKLAQRLEDFLPRLKKHVFIVVCLFIIWQFEQKKTSMDSVLFEFNANQLLISCKLQNSFFFDFKFSEFIKLGIEINLWASWEWSLWTNEILELGQLVTLMAFSQDFSTIYCWKFSHILTIRHFFFLLIQKRNQFKLPWMRCTIKSEKS